MQVLTLVALLGSLQKALSAPIVITREHTAAAVTVTDTYTTITNTHTAPTVEILVSDGVTYTFTLTDATYDEPTTFTTVVNKAATTPAVTTEDTTEATTETTSSTTITLQQTTQDSTPTVETTTQAVETSDAAETTAQAVEASTAAVETTAVETTADETTADETTAAIETSTTAVETTAAEATADVETTTAAETTSASLVTITNVVATASAVTVTTTDVSTNTHTADTVRVTTTLQAPTAVATSIATPTATTSTPTTTSTQTSTSTAATTDALTARPTAIVYSPYNDDSTCKDYDTVKSDLELIHSVGIYKVRVYGTDCNSIQTVLPNAAALGMTVNQGFWFSDAGADSIDTAVTDVIAYGEENGWSVFDFITIGNEAVQAGYLSVSELISKISSVRSQIEAAGYSGQFTTSEPPVIFENNPSLCNADVDFIGVNPHAYFDTYSSAATAGEFVKGQVAIVKGYCTDKDILVTETGYPSAGITNGGNIPTKANQKIAIINILAEMNNEVTILSTYDDYWKAPGDYGIEQSFGIIDLYE